MSDSDIFVRVGDGVIGTISSEKQYHINRIDGKAFVEADTDELVLVVSDKDGVLLFQQIDGTIRLYPEESELDLTIRDGVISLRRHSPRPTMGRLQRETKRT